MRSVKLIPQIQEGTVETGAKTHIILEAHSSFELTGRTGAKAATVRVISSMNALRASDAASMGAVVVTGTIVVDPNTAFLYDAGADFSMLTSSTGTPVDNFSRSLNRGPTGLGEFPTLGVNITLAGEAVESNPTKTTASDSREVFIKHSVASHCGAEFLITPFTDSPLIVVKDLTNPVDLKLNSVRISPQDNRGVRMTALVWTMAATCSKTEEVGDLTVLFKASFAIYPRGCPEDSSNADVQIQAYFSITADNVEQPLQAHVSFMANQHVEASLNASALTKVEATGNTKAQPITQLTELRSVVSNDFKVLDP
jgi:hypothetical protein